MGKKENEIQPDYYAMRDSWKIRLRVEDMMDKTKLDKGKTVRLNLELPEELMTFAAWLGMREQRYEKGGIFTTDISDIIQTPLSTEDYKAAAGLICDLLFKNLMEKQYEALCQNAHPYLYENPNIDSTKDDEPF